MEHVGSRPVVAVYRRISETDEARASTKSKPPLEKVVGLVSRPSLGAGGRFAGEASRIERRRVTLPSRPPELQLQA